MAVFCAILAGIAKPVLALFVGDIFNALSEFGAGTISGPQMTSTVNKWALATTLLGAVTWMSTGGMFWFWIIFGELQAQSARESIFKGLLNNEMEWFDLREDGVSTLMTRIQA